MNLSAIGLARRALRLSKLSLKAMPELWSFSNSNRAQECLAGAEEIESSRACSSVAPAQVAECIESKYLGHWVFAF